MDEIILNFLREGSFYATVGDSDYGPATFSAALVLGAKMCEDDGIDEFHIKVNNERYRFSEAGNFLKKELIIPKRLQFLCNCANCKYSHGCDPETGDHDDSESLVCEHMCMDDPKSWKTRCENWEPNIQ